MKVVIPFHAVDIEAAKRLLLWIDELGGAKKFECVLAADAKQTDSDVAEIFKLAKHSFKKVTLIRTPYSIKLSRTGDSPWPVGPNWCYYTAACYMAMTQKDSFLWLESDCVPLSEGWLDKIESEYRIHQKPFMGPVIETQNKSFIPHYLNGTAVYPANALKYFHGPMVDFLKGAGNAFDLAGSSQTVPNAHFSALIQHGYTDDKGINHWGTHPNAPLVFKTARADGDGENVVTPAVIHREAVLFHPCKNGSLIELLRKSREQVKVAA